jgi:hypothetical protein
MMSNRVNKKWLILLLAIALLLTTTPLGAAVDLTGVWGCDDGGTYYVRQINNNIWWFGEQDPSNPGWSNVARGTITGTKITLSWADVPKGGAMGSGNLILLMDSENQLHAIQKTGGFGGSTWTR